MPLPLPDEITGEDMDAYDHLSLAYQAVKAAVGHFDRYALLCAKSRTHPDIESVILPLLALQESLASRVGDPDFYYERDNVSAMDYLKLTHRMLAIAEHYFNRYTVYGGLNRLIPFVGDTASAIIGAKDDIEYQLGFPDAPYPLEFDPLQTARSCLESALREFNTFAYQQGFPSTYPLVAVTNGNIMFAMENVQAFIDKRSSEGGDDAPGA